MTTTKPYAVRILVEVGDYEETEPFSLAQFEPKALRRALITSDFMVLCHDCEEEAVSSFRKAYREAIRDAEMTR